MTVAGNLPSITWWRTPLRWWALRFHQRQERVLLVVFKLVAVTISYASGNAGGIFGPSLFIGAMLGGSLGSVAHHLWPVYTAAPGAYALVGMGTLFA
jgi:H+/Cl- antiporter ClcA